MKRQGEETGKGLVKVLKWIIVLLIPLNLLVIATSFAFPGRLRWFDNYQVAVQKMVVHQLDKPRQDKLLHGEHVSDHTGNVILYDELMPFLDSIRPGSLFFSVQGRRVSSIFIRSDWKHCGIFIGTLPRIEQSWGKNHALVRFLRPFYSSGNEYLVFDSSYDRGVSVHGIREMADLEGRSTLRKLILFECNLRKDVWSQALLDNLAHIGKPYDYCFVLDNDRSFYCSEFVNKLLPLELNYFQPSAKIAGRPLLLPSDLVETILDKGLDSGTFTYTACVSKKKGTMFIQTLQQHTSATRQQHVAWTLQ